MQYLTLVAAALAAGTAYAQNNATNLTLTDAIAGTDELSALGALLSSYPDLAGALANATNVTILAPNNDAIQALMGAANATSMNATEEQITALLQYHVLNGLIYADNATSTPAFVPTLLNSTEYTSVSGGQVVEIVEEDDNVVIYSGLRNNASVVTADVAYNNGLIHIIDSVLTIPLNASDTALIAGLTDLAGALSLANLTADVDNLTDVTIFAPTNQAFTAIGSALGTASAEDVAAILQYHVINGTVAYSSTLISANATTLGGENVTILIQDGAVFINQARVIIADVLVANGVCHVIDSVLNPNNTAAAPVPDSTEAAVAFDGASSSSIDLTSGLPTQSTTAGAGLTSTNPNQASDYATPTGSSLGENPQNTATDSSSGLAPRMPLATGAVGAAALFGAGAFIANF